MWTPVRGARNVAARPGSVRAGRGETGEPVDVPVPKRTAQNNRSLENPLHVYEYTMEMTVLRVISGPWVGVAP